MSNKKRNSGTAALVCGSGLIVTDYGLKGLVFETTPLHALAVKRHERVCEFVDECDGAPSGGLVLILLVLNELLLTLSSLKAAVSPDAQIYADGEVKYLEFSSGNGWIDRREISPQSAAVIEKNGGCEVADSDWRWVVRTLCILHPQRPHREALAGFLADSQAWWVNRTTGPIFGHVIGLRPFQVLTRAALARRHSEMPQLSEMVASDRVVNELSLLQTARTNSKSTITFDAVITYAGQVARAKESKDHGRDLIIENIKMAIPHAAREGRVQLIVLGATRHAVASGGLRGTVWAPVTIYEYLRQGLKELVVALLENDFESLDGWGWLELYENVKKEIRKSQRPKFGAFLEVFHRYLVIAGFDPLPRSLSGGSHPAPPAAAVIWPHELQRAIEYVEVRAQSKRIRLQATLGLVFAFWIPLRTVELWCLRVRDVHLFGDTYVDIYARRRDGVGKAPSLRRQEEVHVTQLKALLIDMVRMRRQDDAGDDDVLLGEPGKPDLCHEEMATTTLMNAALKWATGDFSASFYDLRHSVFSWRAEPVLMGGSGQTDVAEFQQVAAQGGHAGPSSTAAYIHQIERAIAELSRASRPQSWVKHTPTESSGIQSVFGDVAAGLLAEGRPPLEQFDAGGDLAVTTLDLSLEKRTDIIWRVSQNFNLESVAGGCDVPLPAVHEAVTNLVHAMVQVRLVRYSAAATIRKQCQAISAHALWARAARQPKYESIARTLGEHVAAGNWLKLRLLWQDWSLCRDGETLAFTNPRPAARIVEFLQSAGVSKQQLVVVSARDAAPLPTELVALKITSRPVNPRKGRSGHRLFLAERGVQVRDASGATVSVLGFHWWMLQIGSILIARGES